MSLRISGRTWLPVSMPSSLSWMTQHPSSGSKRVPLLDPHNHSRMSPAETSGTTTTCWPLYSILILLPIRRQNQNKEPRRRRRPRSQSSARSQGPQPRPALLSEPGVLCTPEAAEYVGLSPATLETRRTRGGDPPFVKLGVRVVYRLEDLDGRHENGASHCRH